MNDSVLANLLFAGDELGQEYLRLALMVDALDSQADVTIDCIWYSGLDGLRAQRPQMLPLAVLKDRLTVLFGTASGVESRRGRVLAARVNGLSTRLEVLEALAAGRPPMTMVDEWGQIYGVPMEWQAEDGVDLAHRQIEDLIPIHLGGDSVPERINLWRDSLRVPALVQDEPLFRLIVERAIAATRQRALGMLGEDVLPPADFLRLQFPLNPYFSGELKMWGSYASYAIARHTQAPPILAGLLDTVPHELLHVVHAWLWYRLACQRGWSELTAWLTFDPTLALLEGTAELAQEFFWPHEQAVDLTMQLYGMADVDLDRHELSAFMQLKRLFEQLSVVRDNAALMVDQGYKRTEVDEYLVQRALYSPGRLDSWHGFVEAVRSYIWVYPYALSIYRAWLRQQPDRTAAMKRLLTELLIPSEIEQDEPEAPSDQGGHHGF
ncbi:hypothetical protein KJ596_03415 [Patescibacteria group bacterium]|nr:hypothetical protein [Patescibacteria group bacterium]MBU1867935.1 hypothetical protein [Patescibacteria group bacterium]